MGETLRVDAGEDGLQAMLDRACGLDASALVRLRQIDAKTVEVFVTTPFNVVASRRILGEASRDGAVVDARTTRDQIAALNSATPTLRELDLGTPRDPGWPGALPPAAGFTLLDTVPVDVVRSLADEGQRLARQFSGPLGPPASLLDQKVIEFDAEDSSTVGVPMRMIFTCTSLGFIPGFAAPMDVPRHLRVSHRRRWVRVDAPFGSVYHSTGISLF